MSCTAKTAVTIAGSLTLHASALVTGSAARSEVVVPADANLWGAGHAVPPDPGGNGGGTLPIEVALPDGAAVVRFTSVTGTINFGGGPVNGPEGVDSPCDGIASWDGIAGPLIERARFLAGVFLDDSEPEDPPPAALDQLAGISFTSVSPEIAQGFFIGDGLTGTGDGVLQEFHVPTGATRLFLGFFDYGVCWGLPGWYGDNSGEVQATIAIESPNTISFDFDSGVDLTNFTVFNVGELFTITTEGPELRISKPEDDGTVLPLGFLLGGIQSTFTIDGDFSVTIDITLHVFPPTGGPCCPLNEALLRIEWEDESMGFMIYRIRMVDSNNISTWVDGVGVIASQPSTLTDGRLRILRSGTTLSTWFSEGDGEFIQLVNVTAWDGPFRVQPFVAQGKSVSGISRSTTAIDISFDNLVIEADQINFPCPADINGDGFVNVSDFLHLLAEWGECPGCPEDIDGDGTVGVLDFLLLLSFWGPCP
ncbi:MAG: hypothetical protein ACYS7M_05055 [Planctomycetota bacterium]|jgi:hypothetical protein